VHLLHDEIERLLFPAEFLGALGIVPDLGIFERPVDGLEAGFLYIDVKDTSAVRPGVRAVQRRYLRSG
jgi:hypothetical protein